MTSEHLRPLLDAPADLHLFFKAAEQFAQASMPEPILEGIRLGRTALQKPQGGVRGIVVVTLSGDWWPRPWPNNWGLQWRHSFLHSNTP